MIETAIQVTEGRIPTADLEAILGWGKKMLAAPTELLEGVEEALRAVNSHHELLLITKGDLFDLEHMRDEAMALKLGRSWLQLLEEWRVELAKPRSSETRRALSWAGDSRSWREARS
jgi:hypothetical protein